MTNDLHPSPRKTQEFPPTAPVRATARAKSAAAPNDANKKCLGVVSTMERKFWCCFLWQFNDRQIHNGRRSVVISPGHLKWQARMFSEVVSHHWRLKHHLRVACVLWLLQLVIWSWSSLLNFPKVAMFFMNEPGSKVPFIQGKVFGRRPRTSQGPRRPCWSPLQRPRHPRRHPRRLEWRILKAGLQRATTVER